MKIAKNENSIEVEAPLFYFVFPITHTSMKWLVCLLLSLSLCLSFVAGKWEILEKADKYESLSVRVALKQQNLDVLEVYKYYHTFLYSSSSLPLCTS